MATSYEIPNIINQGKNIGTCNNPYFFYITTGQRIKKLQFFMRKFELFNSEALNLKSIFTAVKIIHNFKVDSLRKFYTAMWLKDMNPRKQSTVDREKKVLEIMQIFSEEGEPFSKAFSSSEQSFRRAK